MANADLNKVLERDIKSVKELRAAIKEYQDSLVGADATSEQYKETTDKLAVAQDELKAVTKAGREGVIQYADSIAGLEKKYRDMYNEYKQMSEAMRNSDAGKQQAADLKALSDQLNDLKKGVGNWKDNIGRYSESVMDAFSKMGGSVGGLVGPFATATKGVNAFSASLKANPVGAVIGLIMTLYQAIKQLVGGLKDNEESQMRLNQAMATFQPYIDKAKNAVDAFGQAIVSIIEFIAKVVDKLRVAKAAFTDFLGITKGAKDAVKEQQKVYQDLAKSVNDLTLKKREYQKANAEDKAEVERLREEASETENLAQKKELLEQAKAKQEEIDNRNIEIAKEELRILEEQSKLTANDAAMNDKLAAAVAKVSEAEAQAAANARNFNKQLNSTTKESNGAASSLKNYREEAKKVYEQSIESSKSEVQKLTEKYEKEKKLLEKYHFDTTALTKQYNKEISKIQAEAIKTAAEKASKAYVDAAKKRISGGEFKELSEALQNQIDNALIGVRQMQRKKKEYDEFMKNYFSLDPAMKEFKEMGKQFIDEINEILGTEFQFPPEISDKSMEEFKEKLLGAEVLFDEAIKKMTASAKKSELEYLMTFGIGNLQDKLQERIGTFDVFDEKNATKYYEQLARLGREELEIEANYYNQIANLEDLSDEERLEARQNYYAAISEMRELDIEAEALQAERTAQVWSDAFDTFDNVANSINTVSNSFTQLMQAEIQSGKLTDQEAKKKKKTMENLAKVTLAVNIAQIAASTAAGVMDVWKSYSAELALNAQTAAATGPAAAATKAVLDAKSLASAILKTTGLGVNAAAQIAAARGGYVTTVSSLRDEGSAGSAAASVATPTTIDSTPYTYSRTLQTAEEEERLNQPIWVSVTDINNMQNKVKVVDEESSF